jgi:hypothetical protein
VVVYWFLFDSGTVKASQHIGVLTTRSPCCPSLRRDPSSKTGLSEPKPKQRPHKSLVTGPGSGWLESHSGTVRKHTARQSWSAAICVDAGAQLGVVSL